MQIRSPPVTAAIHLAFNFYRISPTDRYMTVQAAEAPSNSHPIEPIDIDVSEIEGGGQGKPLLSETSLMESPQKCFCVCMFIECLFVLSKYW